MTTDIARHIADDGADTTETATEVAAIDIESMVAPPSLGKDVTSYKLDNACRACYEFRSTRALRLVFDWLSDRL